MGSSRRSLAVAAAVLVLLLLLVSTEVVLAQGYRKKVCSKPSNKYRGPCFLSVDCKLECNKEGLPRGRCSSFAGKCLCSHHGCK
ncbi:hypothetical protein ZWY2020_036195 [Hordeum vulgare]|nr:hypothetical protein ZWY2020_036195 [Hordeum vulgare]